MINYGLGVKLGTIDENHIETLRYWRNDYAIRKWTRQNDMISQVNQENWYDKQSADPTIKMYTIIDESDRIVGVCGLTGIDLVNRRAEFSLYIAPGLQGKGHGEKALKSLITQGFNTYGLQVIYGETFQENPAAKLFVKLGLTLEGVRRNFYYRDSRFIDAHLYSILRSEWEASKVFPKEQLC